jgi:pilus assembly protein Flp/PilA
MVRTPYGPFATTLTAQPGGDAVLPAAGGLQLQPTSCSPKQAVLPVRFEAQRLLTVVPLHSTGVSMKKAIQQFLRDEEGAAAIEYALLVGLISIMVIGGATLAGTSIQTIFTTISGALSDASKNTGKTPAGG